MIHRKFNNLKFTRTYIGGSKQRELEIFTVVQGTKEDNSDCNWIEYRRLLIEYCDDILNIVLTWVYVYNVLRIIFLGLALLISFINPVTSIPVLVIFGIFHYLYNNARKKENIILLEYKLSLDVINRETGLELGEN